MPSPLVPCRHRALSPFSLDPYPIPLPLPSVLCSRASTNALSLTFWPATLSIHPPPPVARPPDPPSARLRSQCRYIIRWMYALDTWIHSPTSPLTFTVATNVVRRGSPAMAWVSGGMCCGTQLETFRPGFHPYRLCPNVCVASVILCLGPFLSFAACLPACLLACLPRRRHYLLRQTVLCAVT